MLRLRIIAFCQSNVTSPIEKARFHITYAKTNITYVAVFLGGEAFGQEKAVRSYNDDSLGNRLAATNQIRFTSQRLFFFQPSIALPGDRFDIYGENLPAGNTAGVTVTVKGLVAKYFSTREKSMDSNPYGEPDLADAALTFTCVYSRAGTAGPYVPLPLSDQEP